MLCLLHVPHVVLYISCCSKCVFVYGTFYPGAIDLSTLYVTLFLQTSLQFIQYYPRVRLNSSAKQGSSQLQDVFNY